MTSVGALEFTLRANEAPVLKSLGAVEAAAKKTAQQAVTVGKSLSESLQEVAIEAGIAAAAIGALFAKAAADFVSIETPLKKAAVIAGESGTKAFESLRKEVTRMGIETTKLPSDIANLTVSLSQAGFTLRQQTKMLEGLTKAAEASGLGVQEAGDIISTATRIFGFTADETMRVADAMVTAANSARTDLPKLGNALAYVGSSAVAANQSIEDVSVLIGVLGNVGIDASMAGTNLRAMLDRLKVASAGADTEFANLVRGSKKMTEAYNQLASKVRDAEGNMRPILDILPEMRASMAQMSQQDRDILAKALFGVEGGNAFLAIMNTSQSEIDALREKVINSSGNVLKAGQEMTKGLGGSIELLQGSFETLSSGFGEQFAKVLEPTIRGIAGIVNEMIKFPPVVKQGILVVGGLAFALTSATASIAAFELANGRAKAAVIAQSIAKARDILVTTNWTKVMLQGAVAAGKFAWGFRGVVVALAKAAVVAGALYTLNEAIQSSGRYSQALADSNKELEKSIVELSEASQKGSGIFQEYGDYYTAQEAANRRVADSLGWVAQAVDEVTKAYRFLFRDSTDAIIGQIQTWIDKILELLKLPPQITNAFTSAFQKIGKPLLDTFLPVASIAKQLNLLEKPATNYERAIQKTQIETAKLTGTIDAALNTFQKFQTGTKLSAEEQEKLQKGLQASKVELEAQIQKYPELEGVLKPYLAQVNNAIGALEKQTESEKKNTQAKKEQATAIEQLTAAYKEQAGLRQQDFDQAKVTTSGAVARNEIGADEARQKDLAAEKTYLEEMVRLNTEAAAKLRANAKLAADDKKQEYLDEALKLEQEAQSMRIQIQENGNQQIVAKNEATLNKLRAANEKANAAIVASAQAREAALLQASNEREAQIFDALKRGVINQQEYDRQIAAARRESEQASVNAAIQTSQARIAAIQKEIEQVASLRQQGVISAQEAAAQELQLTQNLSQEKTNLVQAEINAQQLNRDAQLAAIQEQRDRFVEAMDIKIAANERATAAIEANAQREQAVRDRVLASLEAERALIEARAGLSTALAAAEQQATQFKIDGYTRAIEIQQQLASGEITSKEQQKALENELRLLGVSRQTEVLDLVKKRQAQEDLLAQQQRDAMLAQQEQQRVLLENEIRRNELLDRQAIATARVNELLGQQAVLQAQLNLAKADPTNATEVANLQQQLEISRQIAEQARGTVEAAIDNAAATAKVNQIKRETLKIEQETERKAFDKAQQTRNEVQNQELIRAKLEDQAKARGKNTQRTLETQQAQQGVTAAVNTTTTAVGRMGDAIDNATDSAAGLRSEIEGAAKAASAIPAAIAASTGEFKETTRTSTTTVRFSQEQQKILERAKQAIEAAKDMKLDLKISGELNELPTEIKQMLERIATTKLFKAGENGGPAIFPDDNAAIEAIRAIEKVRQAMDAYRRASEAAAQAAEQARETGNTDAATQLERLRNTRGTATDLAKFVASLERTYQAPSAIPAGERGTVQIDSSQVAAISNDGVEARLDTLIDVNRQALASPRSLTVSSPEPVKDAAAIFGEMSRNATIREGL